jgi:lipid-A-disaccharide synthase
VLDLMICIFPFEKEFYERSGLRTEFCGHPLVDRTAALRSGWTREPNLIGWFPGSRFNEVKRLFPVMLEAARAIRLALPQARFAVAAANEAIAGRLRLMADAADMPEARQWIETGTVYDLMQRASAGAVASGTATLEAACFGLPYTLVYRVSPATYLAAKTLVRIRHIGIVNVLAGREVVRELVQGVAAETVSLLQDTGRREQLKCELAEIVETLGAGGAYARAAKAVTACLAGVR